MLPLRKYLLLLPLLLLSAGAADAGTTAQKPTPAATAILTPAQIATLKANRRKAQFQFVARISAFLGVKRQLVERGLSEEGRLVDPVPRLISSLERDLKRPLSDIEKAEIRQADADWRAELLRVEARARGKSN